MQQVTLCYSPLSLISFYLRYSLLLFFMQRERTRKHELTTMRKKIYFFPNGLSQSGRKCSHRALVSSAWQHGLHFDLTLGLSRKVTTGVAHIPALCIDFPTAISAYTCTVFITEGAQTWWRQMCCRPRHVGHVTPEKLGGSFLFVAACVCAQKRDQGAQEPGHVSPVHVQLVTVAAKPCVERA